ncbi:MULTISPECIES: gentisate 1,2-dioxygenase [unclassified Sphingobium]|uniref:gentisate 1,2-dioxygenase n=1 Tax=unclassified Sphingobium TaxID=2611147 RepID=UPI000D17A23F|nr:MULTISPECIES: gentisate 1,2-dioxygenase [unclassified Sphingobium]MBG6116388.1 gentisate 1,2-dioxygenase [Sphingobium sp. JAI105]PSO09632.1 gentisate 1,2-dioxygenase [Sphingobium sp. AEW4]TWC97413.1 gentisate 1,2-dioxygenase [Sphingobium sp. AEW010]TWD17775.1 gentisate 1,2-dioxygenase [Sphingobium sp. AEW013]TWD20029.1 gentisate 1,2-dioxygenase [Sphingobium sp. AEW001]
MTTSTGLAVPNEDRKTYYDALDGEHLGPLWESLKGLVPSEPRPKAVPHAWRYAQVRPRLLEAGSLITAEEAERRVLVLQNPGLPGASQITDTIYAGLQLILPGEIAPAHRHTQSALRFVIEGQGAFTAVDGERTTMHPGDFIITPAWTWHDHGHDGDEPVVWMDGLDVPLVRFLGTGFREEYNDRAHSLMRPEGDADARYGAGLLPIDLKPQATSPIFNYPYARTRESLETISRTGEPDPYFGFALRYVNPTTGDWAIPTIAASMRLLPAGCSTKSYKSSDGAVLVVVEGRLRATVGDARFELGAKDIVAIPGWTTHQFEASEDAVFFVYSDRPVHEKLGLWREFRG